MTKAFYKDAVGYLGCLDNVTGEVVGKLEADSSIINDERKVEVQRRFLRGGSKYDGSF
jgi:hypothetical protein